MNWDLTASKRAHGAQLLLTTTTLVCEALVVLFATLVAHGLLPEIRIPAWIFGLSLSLALLINSRIIKNAKAFGYWTAIILQIAVIAFGILIPAMYFIGAFFAILLMVGIFKGRAMDFEKDRVDQQFTV